MEICDCQMWIQKKESLTKPQSQTGEVCVALYQVEAD